MPQIISLFFKMPWDFQATVKSMTIAILAFLCSFLYHLGFDLCYNPNLELMQNKEEAKEQKVHNDKQFKMLLNTYLLDYLETGGFSYCLV